MNGDNLRPWDADFFRRNKQRRLGHDQETIGPVRFFQTVAGPGYTAYPASGNVVYAQLLKNVRMASQSIGATGPEFTATNEFAYLVSPNGALPAQGAIVQAMRIGPVWWIQVPSAPPLIIRFTIQSVQGNNQVVGKIFATPAGMSLSQMPGLILGNSVYICDPDGCFFNEPITDLLGRSGRAVYAQPTGATACQPYAGNNPAPQWEVFSLCCPSPACSQ